MLVVMDKSTYEERLSQPLHTNKKQNKLAVTFVTGYKSVFNIPNSKNEFYFKKTLFGEDFIQFIIPPVAYEIKLLNKEIKRIIIDKNYYTQDEYPFKIKPNFSTLGSFIELKPQEAIVGFVYDDSIRNLLRYHETTLYKENSLSQNPVDILKFDSVFLECDNAKGMIFKSKRSGIFQNFTMDVNPG